MEGVSRYPDGEGHHEQVQMKGKRSPKRKAIRVASEETQDYVKEANDMNQEEAQEISFVPSANSVPQKPLFRCDNQCSEKTLSFWQFASVVIKEGEESHTTNLCQQCFNKVSGGRRRQTIGKVAVVLGLWREKAHRGRL